MTTQAELNGTREFMTELINILDEVCNPGQRSPNKSIGFVVLLFPYGVIDGTRCNYASNGASRKDIAVLFREMAAKFEGMPDIPAGRA